MYYTNQPAHKHTITSLHIQILTKTHMPAHRYHVICKLWISVVRSAGAQVDVNISICILCVTRRTPTQPEMDAFYLWLLAHKHTHTQTSKQKGAQKRVVLLATSPLPHRQLLLQKPTSPSPPRTQINPSPAPTISLSARNDATVWNNNQRKGTLAKQNARKARNPSVGLPTAHTHSHIPCVREHMLQPNYICRNTRFRALRCFTE